MASAFLRSKVDERAALTDLTTGILEKCSKESRDPSAEERAKLDDYGNRIKVLDGSIAELRTSEEANQRFLETAARIEDAAELVDQRSARGSAPQPVAHLSAGEAFIQSEAFKNYRGRGTMEPVEFHDFLGVETRMATISGPITEADLNVPATRWDGPAGPRTTTPFLRIIGREVVSTNSVSYITWDDAATGAAKVAETDLKPEASLTPSEHPLNLDTYAFWKAITRQALEDYPRIRSIVETKLRLGLADTLEAAAIATLAGVADGTGGTNLAGIRQAIATLQGRGYTPSAIAMNPADAATLDLEVMSGTLSGPSSPGRYWGLQVIAVGGIAQGSAYVGDFGQGVTWFDRSSASVYMSDSHADYFIRNLFVILAEERSAFALTEPQAIVQVEIATEEPEPVTARAASSKS